MKSPLYLLVVALALGWGTDLFFYDRSLGISVPLFVGLLLVALFGLGRMEGTRPVKGNLWLLAPLLFFGGMVAVRANATLTTLNLLTSCVLVILLLYFYSEGRVWRLGLLGYPVALFVSAREMLARPAPVVGASARQVISPARRQQATPLLRGLLLAIPVLMVFTSLLAMADSFFASSVQELFRFKYVSPSLPSRLLLIVLAAWVIAGALLYALARRERGDPAQAESPGPRPFFTIGFVEGATVLALVNSLFLVFAWFQFTYLFSGEAARTMDYVAYREYVRRGFGELLLVALLTMLLILGLQRLVWKETPREESLFRALCTQMVGLAGVLLVSALWRMFVWENIEFYINTELRLYVRWFIVWLGVLFGWLLLTLWAIPRRFGIGALLATLCYLATINVINPDADVAAYNLRRGDELSTRYLHLLSEDAVPTLVDGLSWTGGTVNVQLREHLWYRLESMETRSEWRGWQSFHLSRNNAYDKLLQLRREAQIYPPSDVRGSAYQGEATSVVGTFRRQYYSPISPVIFGPGGGDGGKRPEAR
jgi:hypothetical protein